MQGSPVLPPVQAGFRSGKAIVVTVVSSRSRQQSPAVGFVSCVRWNEGRCAEGDCEWAPGCVEDAQMSSKGETAYLGTENGLRKAHVVLLWEVASGHSKAVRMLRPEPRQHTGCGPQAPPHCRAHQVSPTASPVLYVSCKFKTLRVRSCDGLPLVLSTPEPSDGGL